MKVILEYILGFLGIIAIIGLLVTIFCFVSLFSMDKLYINAFGAVIETARENPPPGYTSSSISQISDNYLDMLKDKNLILLGKTPDSLLAAGKIYLSSNGTDTASIISILETMDKLGKNNKPKETKP